jgi:DNA polymerase IV
MADDPKVRRILHCDMDCFYAAVHMRDEPELANQPLVVGGDPSGRGVVAAANYEARKFGIHSAMPASRALRLCPQLVFKRPDFSLYREESEEIFSIYAEFTPLVQPASLDEAYLDVSGHLADFGSATAIAVEIRKRVKEQRNLTVSVGVGPNRLVAKIASDFDKPDGLTVVRPEQVQKFLDQLAVRKLHGVGPATEKKLAKLGINSVAELRKVSEKVLTANFGVHGHMLFAFSRGRDDRPVRVGRIRKSLGTERTFKEDVELLEEMDAQIDKLCERVSKGLAERELLAGTITVKVRYADFTTLTRGLTLKSPTHDFSLISATARELLRRTDAPQRAVRLLGVSASSLMSKQDRVQLSLL